MPETLQPPQSYITEHADASAGLALERLGVDHQPHIDERSGTCLIYVTAHTAKKT